ncbi:conserved hypothetical protein [Carnobacterium sp. 17-4]|uniref:hypothetical protein n=1 Tax=Carnobacterium sp. (strain 17-4) TaxID=208596 RepID=UPI0002058C0C|nr:hypothetical protein [Carnobacterium sp. 17-4]AEB30138.1 conserved hypothetical protein [Carnobacterium sp. 17-4]
MTLTSIRVLLTVSILLLINFESQSVLAATNDETESSEILESAPSNEINEPVETQKPTPENKVIVSDQVSIEPKIAHAGEQRSFSLTLQEELSFETIVLSYLASDTKTETTVELTYDAAKKQYVGQLETTKETTSGHWLLTKAVGIDENEVSSVLETRNLTNEDSELKVGDFEVLPHPADLIDLTSIKVEPKAVKVGEKLQFSLHSVENEQLTNVTVVYRSLTKDGESIDQQLLLSLRFNEETKAYEGELASITNELMGDWVIDHLSGSDEQGNPFTLYNQFVIGLDKENLQKQIDELNKQLLIEQTAAEIEDKDVQENRDLLLEKIQQLEFLKEAKEKQLQADLSIGNFTIEEQLTEEEPDTIDAEMPILHEEESNTSEKEVETSLAESKTEVSKEEMTVELKDVQKKAIATSTQNENQVSTKESAQAIDASSITEETVTDEKNEAAAFSNSSLFIVLAAFVIINGFIFKF